MRKFASKKWRHQPCHGLAAVAVSSESVHVTTMLHVQFLLASRCAKGQHRQYSFRYIYIYAYIFEQISRNEQLKHQKKTDAAIMAVPGIPAPTAHPSFPFISQGAGETWHFNGYETTLVQVGTRPFQLLRGPTAISLNDAVNVQCLAAKPFDVTWSWYIPTF